MISLSQSAESRSSFRGFRASSGLAAGADLICQHETSTSIARPYLLGIEDNLALPVNQVERPRGLTENIGSFREIRPIWRIQHVFPPYCPSRLDPLLVKVSA